MSDIFSIGYDLAKHMLESNPPRTVGNQKNLVAYGELAEMVALGADGDYLEIGVYNGTSAIVAARVKQALGLGGRVVGLDDFAWYKKERQVNQEQMIKTLAYFQEYGVADAIDLVLGTTRDFPPELKDRLFASAFIDGDHWTDFPYRDFLLVAPLVTGWILFDDVDLFAVNDAIEKIEANHHDWQIVKRKNGCVLLKRVSA